MADATVIEGRNYLRNSAGLTVDATLKKAFPAVFSSKPLSTMSEDYHFYPSWQIIDVMKDLGCALVELRQQHSLRRDPQFQMHSLRFRPLDARAGKVGDTFPEIQVINSHNGRNKFAACSGLFRLACLNGLVVPDSLLGSVSTRHFGKANAFDTIKGVVATLAKRLPDLRDKVESWRNVNLDPTQQVRLAKMLGEVRGIPEWVKPEQLIEHHREIDAPSRVGYRDLWTTFNVIQENAINRQIERSSKGEERRSKTKPVQGALANFSINRLLWAGAEQAFGAIKAGKPVPAHFDPELAPDLPKPAATAVAEEPKKAAPARKVAAKAEKPVAVGRKKPAPAPKKAAKADLQADPQAEQRAKRAEAARRYRAKKKAEAEGAPALETAEAA